MLESNFPECSDCFGSHCTWLSLITNAPLPAIDYSAFSSSVRYPGPGLSTFIFAAVTSAANEQPAAFPSASLSLRGRILVDFGLFDATDVLLSLLERVNCTGDDLVSNDIDIGVSQPCLCGRMDATASYGRLICLRLDRCSDTAPESLLLARGFQIESIFGEEWRTDVRPGSLMKARELLAGLRRDLHA